MRVFIVAASALVLVSGCGALGRPSDKQAMVASCIDKGEAETTCNCVANALEANLPPELFEKVAQAVGRDKKDMVEYMFSLPADELFAFSKVTNELEACGNAAATGG
jgi:hypothetical protein